MAMEKWIVDGPKTIDLEVVRHLRVALLGGALDVIAHDEPVTRVEVSALTGRDLVVSIDGDTLTIDHPQLEWVRFPETARTLVDKPSATVSVLVPKRVDVQAKAADADVLVVGVDGEVSITTASGRHFVDGTEGHVALTAAAGSLSVRGHRGSVSAVTATGDATLSGEFDVVTTTTVSGETIVDARGEAPRRVAMNSVSGAITLRLPETAHPQYRVTTVSSRAQVEGRPVEPLFGGTYRGEDEDPTPADSRDGDTATTVRIGTVTGRTVVVRGTDDADTQDRGVHDASRAKLPPEVAAKIDLSSLPRVVGRFVQRVGDQVHVRILPDDRPNPQASPEKDAGDKEASA